MQPSNILVIDDEPTICTGCSVALSETGHLVETRMTGKAGLDAILRGPHDVVVLDLKLPDMDGMEILKTVRRKKPGVHIIVMTGYSTVENAVEAMKLGAFDYLAKPFSNDELVFAVERAIEKKRLVEENLSLRKELLDRFGFQNIVGETPKIRLIYDQIQKVAPTETTVLLIGESGTGKELFARAVHANSQRATRQFVAIDCSTLSPNLLESELFGHVRGAFTGAVQDRAGIFEMAHGGTLFLDDVANVDLEIQGKLLRVLEMREYRPIGASHFKKTDVRIIAATNKDLKAMVDGGSFREDLFYRLGVFPIVLPPLRERRDDIPKLAYHFLRLFCRKMGKQIRGFTDDALEMLVNHEWPGNVRELKNVVERLVILAERGVLDNLLLFDHLQTQRLLQQNTIPETLEELKAVKKHFLEERFGRVEKLFLAKALEACDGNISQAAKKVGMQRPNFYSLMKKHGFSAKNPKDQAE